MGRSSVPRLNQSPATTARSTLLIVGGTIVVLFALVGVISAGAFVGDKMSGKKTAAHKPVRAQGTPVALQDISRAQAQATAIVKSAQASGKSIIKSSTDKATKKSRAILANAQKQSTATASSGSPSTTNQNGTSNNGTTGYNNGYTYGTPGTGYAQGGSPGYVPPGPVQSQSLRRFPRTWQVIAYSVNFGAGPGSAGGVTLINRGARAYSGQVIIQYVGTRGVLGSAVAPFSNLPPGQYSVPLNGPPLPPGATYRILVSGIR